MILSQRELEFELRGQAITESWTADLLRNVRSLPAYRLERDYSEEAIQERDPRYRDWNAS